MSILVTCKCGAKFMAKEMDAGRKCKCGKCGTMLTVPVPNAGAAVTAAAEASAVKPRPPQARPAPTAAPASTARSAGTQPQVARPAAAPRGQAAPAAQRSVRPQPANRPPPADDLPAIPDDPMDDLLALEPPPTPARNLLPPTVSPSGAAPTGKKKTKAVPEALAIPGGSRRPVGPKQEGGGFVMSGKTQLMIALAIIIPTILYLGKIGPVKAMQDWSDLKDRATGESTSVIDKAIQAQLSANGGWDPHDPHFIPGTKNLFFDEPIMMIRMPDGMKFQGKSSEGPFSGVYHTRTHEVEADVYLEGKTVHVTGRCGADGRTVSEINGKKVEIVN